VRRAAGNLPGGGGEGRREEGRGSLGGEGGHW
jgi:hypothetical protein